MGLRVYLDLNSGILGLDADFRDMELRRALREHGRNTLKLEIWWAWMWTSRTWNLDLGIAWTQTF